MTNVSYCTFTEKLFMKNLMANDKKKCIFREINEYKLGVCIRYRISEFVRHAVRKSRYHLHSALPLFEVAVSGPGFHVESHFGVFACNYSCRRDFPPSLITQREAGGRVISLSCVS